VLDARAARLVAGDLLARKAWSSVELVRRLRRRGAPDDVARDVVRDLEGRGYLDDGAFARWWAQARAKGRRVGSLRLRQELAAKGIPRDLAKAAIDAAFEEGPEEDRALEAGRRRLSTLARTAPERAATRLSGYLLRRGYPPQMVRRVVTRLVGRDPGAAEADGV